MIGRDGWGTETPSATPLQPKTWNATFWTLFNIWWSAGLVNRLEPHPPLLSTQKMKCSFLELHSLLMIGWASWWTWTPSATPLLPKNWKAHFFIMFNFWWSARLVNGLKTHLPPLSSQKNEMLIFGLHSLWMIGQAGQWTQTLSTTPLQPIKWNAHFWITFNFWWSARLVNGIEPHLPALFSQKKWNATFWITFNFWWSAGLVNGLKSHPLPLSSQRKEMLIFGLHSTSDDQLGLSMDLNPIHHLSPAKKMKCSYFAYVHFRWLAGLVNGLEPHPPPFSSQKNEILIFVLR